MDTRPYWLFLLAILRAESQPAPNVAVADSKFGTAASTSGSGSSAAKNPLGSSWGTSKLGGSTSGTVGIGSAKGSNVYGSSESVGGKGAAASSSGLGSASSGDIFGNKGSVSSDFDGSAAMAAGDASAKAVNEFQPFGIGGGGLFHGGGEILGGGIFGGGDCGIAGGCGSLDILGGGCRPCGGGINQSPCCGGVGGLPHETVTVPVKLSGGMLATVPESRIALGKTGRKFTWTNDNVRTFNQLRPNILTRPIPINDGRYALDDDFVRNKWDEDLRKISDTDDDYNYLRKNIDTYRNIPLDIEYYDDYDYPHRAIGGSAGGSSSATSGHGIASSTYAQGGGSHSSSDRRGSASGTSGLGSATGESDFSFATSSSDRGIASGSSGPAHSIAYDPWGHKGSSSSYGTGSAVETSGYGSSESYYKRPLYLEPYRRAVLRFLNDITEYK